MIFWQNRILTNVKKTVADKCTNVVATRSNVKAKFPTLLVEVTSNSAIAEDMDNEENAVRCVVTIEAYSKTSVNDGKNLLILADSAMRQMGFRRRQGPIEVDPEGLTDVFRTISRYVRVIGASETIKLFED